MGLGGKLLQAQLGAGMARGPLAAQQNEMKLLQQRLAQQFAMQQQTHQSNLRQGEAVFNANLNAITSSEEAQKIGLPATPGLLASNAARIGAQQAQERTLTAQANVAEATQGWQIELAEAKTNQAWKALNLQDLEIEGMIINNELKGEEAKHFVQMAPLLQNAARMRNELAQHDIDMIPLRSLGETIALGISQAQKGLYKEEANLRAAQAAKETMELEMLKTAAQHPGLISPETQLEVARLGVSVMTRVDAATERFNQLFQAAQTGDPSQIDALLAQTTFVNDEQARIVKEAIRDWATDVGGAGLFNVAEGQGLMDASLGFLGGSVPVMEEDIAYRLTQAGAPVEQAQAMQIVRDAFFRFSGVTPEMAQLARVQVMGGLGGGRMPMAGGAGAGASGLMGPDGAFNQDAFAQMTQGMPEEAIRAMGEALIGMMGGQGGPQGQ